MQIVDHQEERVLLIAAHVHLLQRGKGPRFEDVRWALGEERRRGGPPQELEERRRRFSGDRSTARSSRATRVVTTSGGAVALRPHWCRRSSLMGPYGMR